MRITIVLAVLVFSFVLLGSCNSALALDSTKSASLTLDNFSATSSAVEIGKSLISPSSPLYFLKALREKLEGIFTWSDKDRALMQLEFANRRLRETNALVDTKRQDLIEPTLEKYKFHMGRAKGFSKSEDLQVTIDEALSRHLDILERVYDQVGDPRAKLSTRASIEWIQDQNRVQLNTLSLINQQKLIRKIALPQALSCKFLQREASASGLNDVEKEDLVKRVDVCKKDVTGILKDELEELRMPR